MKIVIPLYQGVTQLDFTGPHQFFSRLPETEVITASLGGEPIKADNLVFSELQDLSQIESCDLLCVPGGGGCLLAISNSDYMSHIQRLAQQARYITSVCTGALILGAAGLLENKRAATHWAWREKLACFGAIPDDARVVKDGNVITGGGVTAGIDFALVVIAEIYGEETAQRIQLGLEYAPAPPFNAGRPETAPAEVAASMQQRMTESNLERCSDPRLPAALRDRLLGR
ncbi:DJ-1/PfpI family protein [Pantoea sp. MQR6]|uniref:DJ-1/PfpI family protein n=1 Tax=Pantoea sp. MQR6 TaxID=2907307 RepID=UPI001FA9D52F|nr:DJ-1/PfpI family protein [Pantoea sp. MQR6]